MRRGDDTSPLTGIPFTKMSGSGNDFVVFDGRTVPVERATAPALVRRLSERRHGVGADGVVILLPPSVEDVAEGTAFTMIYCNADGTRAEMCGNAALCSTALAVEWGLADPAHMRFRTDSGVVTARIRGGQPEIDLAAVDAVRLDAGIVLEPGELRIGFAAVGVPHLVVLRSDCASVDVAARGGTLRHHASLPTGGNVNFVAARPDGRFDIRTYERGVEAETLACGTGATAAAILLTAWGTATGNQVALVTLSGMELVATPNRTDAGWVPALRGAGRVVYSGTLR